MAASVQSFEQEKSPQRNMFLLLGVHALTSCGGRIVQELLNLNLAINRIETVENLEGCESLEKLDLTLNRVADQSHWTTAAKQRSRAPRYAVCLFVSPSIVNSVWSVQRAAVSLAAERPPLIISCWCQVPTEELVSLEALQANRHLWSLYLLGNPCDQWHGYRAYVTGVLPQLRTLVIERPHPGPQPASLPMRVTGGHMRCVRGQGSPHMGVLVSGAMHHRTNSTPS